MNVTIFTINWDTIKRMNKAKAYEVAWLLFYFISFFIGNTSDGPILMHLLL